MITRTGSGPTVTPIASLSPYSVTKPVSFSTVGSVTDAHKALVGIAVMLVVLVILVEIAGTSKHAATVVVLFMFGAIAVLGVTHSTTFAEWVKTKPWIP